MKAVAQWREVRNPSSNTNGATATAQTKNDKKDVLDITQTVPTELLQKAAKLTKDRDDALRRLKEVTYLTLLYNPVHMVSHFKSTVRSLFNLTVSSDMNSTSVGSQRWGLPRFQLRR